jgi:hypothetical protein
MEDPNGRQRSAIGRGLAIQLHKEKDHENGSATAHIGGGKSGGCDVESRGEEKGCRGEQLEDNPCAYRIIR